MSKSRKATELLKWYQQKKPLFDGLANTVKSILENLITKAKISIVSVSCRVKTSESLLDKQRRKRYKRPIEEIADFAGLRVITYTEDDAIRVCKLIKTSFDVDVSQSTDKAEKLDVNQIGYRSHHFVCGLGRARASLPEFDAFRGFHFEIQVRTVLQHAWAEVEHDRNYKFAGALPSSLERRLYLISGLLEVGDRELNQLSRDIDEHASTIKSKAGEGAILSEEIDSATLSLSVTKFIKTCKNLKIDVPAGGETIADVVQECRKFGLSTIRDLSALFTTEFLAAADVAPSPDNNEAGIVRDAMMFADLKKYFEVAWSGWKFTDKSSFNLLVGKYGPAAVNETFETYGIELDPSGADYWTDDANFEE